MTKLYDFEVHGLIRGTNSAGEDGYIPFKCVAPQCMNAYQASLYVIGKYKDEDITIDYDNIVQILP